MDAKIESYFYENCIAFNTAASSSLAIMIEESMKFARQNPLQKYKVPHRLKFSGELLKNAKAKAKAKAKFSEIVDIVQNKEFWRIAKSLVELSAPSMNPRRLRLADSDIQGTGKVYHDMFKPWTEKFLETM